jgi:hypothetical protein
MGCMTASKHALPPSRPPPLPPQKTLPQMKRNALPITRNKPVSLTSQLGKRRKEKKSEYPDITLFFFFSTALAHH